MECEMEVHNVPTCTIHYMPQMITEISDLNSTSKKNQWTNNLSSKLIDAWPLNKRLINASLQCE